jgi:Ca2+-binding RTX toxin-like protein
MAYVNFTGMLGVATTLGFLDEIDRVSAFTSYGSRLAEVSASNSEPVPDPEPVLARVRLAEATPGTTRITGIDGFGFPGGVETSILRVAGLIDTIAIDPSGTPSDQASEIVGKLPAVFQRMLRGDDTIELSGDLSFFWGDYDAVTAANSGTMGSDVITALSAEAVGLLNLFGDARSVAAGATAQGGDDIIVGSRDTGCLIFGDFEQVDGTASFGNDVIYGSLDEDQLYGDSLAFGAAAGGNDVLFGLFGDDDLYGGGGNDTLIGDGGGDSLNGGAGVDTASYYTCPNGLTADLLDPGNNTQDAIGDTYVSIENLVGTQRNDTLRGNNAANTIDGGFGDDTLEGNGGNDILIGGAGADTLRGGTHNDTYVLANGTDNVIDTSGVDLVTSTINRTLSGLYAEVENLTLLVNAVTGIGNASANTITGNAKNNTLDGAAGADILSGLGGNDTLIGGAGRDTITGGLGDDTFKFAIKAHSPNTAQRDTITDFDNSGNDRIDISALFGAPMTYRHALAFTAAGQVRINDIAGADVIVEVNTGGSLAADFSISLKGTTLAEMAANDFVL